MALADRKEVAKRLECAYVPREIVPTAAFGFSFTGYFTGRVGAVEMAVCFDDFGLVSNGPHNAARPRPEEKGKR